MLALLPHVYSCISALLLFTEREPFYQFPLNTAYRYNFATSGSLSECKPRVTFTNATVMHEGLQTNKLNLFVAARSLP